MLLEIRHLTRFHYAEPVRESVMELWMQPQKSARQRLVSFELDLQPASQLFSYVDVYGNAVYHFDVPQPHELLTIKATSVVETSHPPVLPDALDLGEWDRLKSDFVRGDSFDFLRPHGFAIETAIRSQIATPTRLAIPSESASACLTRRCSRSTMSRTGRSWKLLSACSTCCSAPDSGAPAG